MKTQFFYLPISLALFTWFPSMQLYFKVQVLMGMRAKGLQYLTEKTIQWKDTTILESKPSSSLLPYSEGKTHTEEGEHNHKLGVGADTPFWDRAPRVGRRVGTPEQPQERALGAPHSSLSPKHGSAPSPRHPLSQRGNSSLIQFKVLNQILPQFFKPLYGSQTPDLHTFSMCKNYTRGHLHCGCKTQTSGPKMSGPKKL